MEVIPNIKSKTLIDFAERQINCGSTIISDGCRSYRKLDGRGYKLQFLVYNPKKNPDHLR
ncbi:transposase [Salsuginibacillus halophilus]|uniref:transposase n=1 Tax=Salsuginibacillus halophilus TaxID=517424 RepID=UPI000D0D76CA